MAFQVVLAVLQVALGHTLQGPFYWLGERAISVATPNAARAEVFGRVVLRAYGTFSHPNILAGWLVVSLLILIMLRSQGLSLVAPRTLLNRNSRLQVEKGSPAGEKESPYWVSLVSPSSHSFRRRPHSLSLRRTHTLRNHHSFLHSQESPHPSYVFSWFVICYLLFVIYRDAWASC